MDRYRYWDATIISLLLLLMAFLNTGEAVAAVIFVTTLEDKIGSNPMDDGGPGCSLQEAIFSANLDASSAIQRYDLNGNPVFVSTECVPGSGDDTIVLPTESVLLLKKVVDDAANPFGPTATPMITSNVTIEAHGATLQFVPRFIEFDNGFQQPIYFRAFAVASSGQLTIRNAYINGFVTHGGNGGFFSEDALAGLAPSEDGGGGGLGAGGAVYDRRQRRCRQHGRRWRRSRRFGRLRSVL